MAAKPKGTLIIIGGHEEKKGDQEILREVARRTGRGRLALVTVASQEPEQMAKEYTGTFKELGLDSVVVLDIRSREEACDEANVKKIADAATIFFTGGDQLRITSQIGDSLLFRCLHERYSEGATIVGTSAGAAAMPETMLVSGPGDASSDLAKLSMAPGLGLLGGVVIDSHFAERGRIGRLLGAVVQNPKNLGIGIDENTAIEVRRGDELRVLGEGAVYVADGATISYSSLSEEHTEGVISIHDVLLHVLSDGDRFRLPERRPEVGQRDK